MSLSKGQKIEAVTWNPHARGVSKQSFYIRVSGDKTGTASFWVRSAGWNWPQFYNEDIEYATALDTPSADSKVIAEDDLMAETNGGRIIAYKAQKDYPAMPPSTNDDDIEWSSYRWEYDAGDTYLLDDEVVYGGGLFTVKVASIIGTPPVIPKYGLLANTDSNYSRIMTPNATVRIIREGVRIEKCYLELKRPGKGANIRVFSREHDSEPSHDYTDTIWLSPGEYHVIYDFEDYPSAGTDRSKIIVTTQPYDDNVKQWAELRVFNSSLSNLASKGATKLLASTFNSTPLATDFDIDKKGGTASNYTGDW